MSDPVISLDTISRQASAAAQNWKPGQPRPANPYDEHLQPAHHREWKRRFEVALVRASAPELDAEASA
jgi:hypothetical protein